MEQKFIEMAKTIFSSIDHYRESGRDDKFNIDSIAEYLQRQFLLQQTPCTTQLPPTEDDFLHIAQFVRRMHNDFTDAELWHEYNKDV